MKMRTNKKYLKIVVISLALIIILSFIPYYGSFLHQGRNGNENNSSTASDPQNFFFINITKITLHDAVITPELNGTYHITAASASFNNLTLQHTVSGNKIITITAPYGNITGLNVWSNTLSFSAINTLVNGILNVITTITGILSGNLTVYNLSIEATYFSASSQQLNNGNVTL